MAGQGTKVSLTQDIAISVFGEALRMKGKDILWLADRVRGYGTSVTCFFEFVYNTYSARAADKMLYKNFMNAPRVFTEFERHLENLKDITPLLIQQDWDVYESYKTRIDNNEQLLTNDLLPLSALFRFMLLSAMDSPEKERYRKDAERQLLLNPSYWIYLKNNAGDLPLAEEVIYEK